jgi:CheY-like chemotaxis protein
MKSILLVDDEADSASALQKTLARFGYHVDVAHTTEAALHMVEKTPFDLILLDLNIRSERSEHPDVAHGTGLVRQLRASRFGPPIVTSPFSILRCTKPHRSMQEQTTSFSRPLRSLVCSHG